MNFILDQLAIGTHEEALTRPPDIDAMLCVAAERDIDPGPCRYHKVPMIDMQPIPVEQMVDAVQWIAGTIQNHRILVFCNAGIGRSPSVVIGYLCCALNYSFGEAVEHVAEQKAYISILPNLIQTIRTAAPAIQWPTDR